MRAEGTIEAVVVVLPLGVAVVLSFPRFSLKRAVRVPPVAVVGGAEMDGDELGGAGTTYGSINQQLYRENIYENTYYNHNNTRSIKYITTKK